MPLTVMKRIRFCAGHRLFGHEGKCSFLHGHNYTADVYVTSDLQDDVGRVIDFSQLKKLFQGWVDTHWDHAFLLWEEDGEALMAVRALQPTRLFVMPYNPTAENMARYLLEEAAPGLLAETGGRAVQVVLWETEDSFAVASAEGLSDSANANLLSVTAGARRN